MNAQEEGAELTVDMFKGWNGYGADASSTGTATVDFNIGNDATLGAGAMVCGTSTVDYLIYADLTGSTKLVIEGTAGIQLRVLMNRQESNSGPLVELNPTIGSDGKVEVDLTTYAYVHINAIKTGWGSPSGKITSVKFVKPSDPLALPKEALKNTINNAKLYNSFGKTTASWNALTDAISTGEAELTSGATTAEKLTAAKGAIETAIANLELKAGYTNLTSAMFKAHSSFGGDATGNAGCAYDVFKSTGMPYGDGNVAQLNYADLSDYDKLIVIASAGKPRFCMNRLTSDGQQAATLGESKMIDINPNNAYTWSTEKYQTIEGSVYMIDLKAIVEDYGFAFLHSIKGSNYANVTVTDMLLYKDPSITLTSTAELEGYKTFFSSEFNYQVDDNTTIYKATAASATSVTLTAVEGKIVPENTPVILKTTNTTDYKITLTPTEEASTADFTGNLLGYANPEKENVYLLAYITDGGLGFYKYTETIVLQVYLNAEISAASKLRLAIVGNDDDTTAISEVASEANEDGVTYNISGQPVGPDYKGIVIKNGKKYIQK